MTTLSALWDQLEARGAIVARVNPHDLDPELVIDLTVAERRRLQIILEAEQPPPNRLTAEEHRRVVEDLLAYAHYVTTGE